MVMQAVVPVVGQLVKCLFLLLFYITPGYAVFKLVDIIGLRCSKLLFGTL